MYDICYAKTPSIVMLTSNILMRNTTPSVDRDFDRSGQDHRRNVLNIAQQDYDPQGSSVTMLIAEDKEASEALAAEGLPDLEEEDPKNGKKKKKKKTDAVVAHLDKSHITVHTYPESHPDQGISTFRADIDVSTCGRISPLTALNYLINSFSSDIVAIDYRVRGFTRDINGKKLFIDHKINSIQNYISKDSRDQYQMVDVNVYQDNIFHTKMILKEFDLDNYLFGTAKKELMTAEKKKIKQRLKKEMNEIFSGRNIPKV